MTRQLNKTKRFLLLLAVTAQAKVIQAKNRAQADENGNVITDNLGWIVFGVVTIVVIGAALKLLGVNVINWVQNQLGIGNS